MFKPKIYDKYGNEVIKFDIIPNLKNYTKDKILQIKGIDHTTDGLRRFANLLQKNNNTCKCHICGEKAQYIAITIEQGCRQVRLYNRYGVVFNVDHIIPKIRGGADHIDNMAFSCQTCNGEKSGNIPDGTLILVKGGNFFPANGTHGMTYPNRFFRLENIQSKTGIWYTWNGTGRSKIKKSHKFLRVARKPMPYDSEVAGFLSVTESLEKLFQWFSEENIQILQKHGMKVAEYESTNYKFYEKEQHWLINQKSAKFIKYHHI